jgi:hypothetical protein
MWCFPLTAISWPKAEISFQISVTSTTCRENKARTEVPEKCFENGGLGAFDDDRRDTFMTRSPVLVRFYRSTIETAMKTKPSSQIETRYQRVIFFAN